MAPTPLARRVGARVVDVVVVLWVLALVVVELDGRFGSGDPLARRAAQPVTSAQLLTGLLVSLALLDTLPTAVWGRSVGKALLGVRVVPVEVAGEGPWGGRPSPRVGTVRAVLRSVSLFGWLLVPYVGTGLVLAVGLSGLVLPGGRGLHDRVAGTAVVDSLVAPGGRRSRHRYPAGAIEPLPLPDVARTALVEVGVPRAVPGAFAVDRRMAVFDEVLFAVGEDPTGRALCIVSPTGEVVAVDPDGQRPPLLAGTSLPRFIDALDGLADAVDPDGGRSAVAAADPEALADPDSWWPTVLRPG
jgi:uncharacterized RDD family membrane protein YckC